MNDTCTQFVVFGAVEDLVILILLAKYFVMLFFYGISISF